MTRDEVLSIVEEHRRWLDGDKAAECANFDGEVIECVDLSGVNLSGANFSNAYINCVNFSRSDLSGVSFRNADIYSSNFADAQLCKSDFAKAFVCSANFAGAALSRVNIMGVAFAGVDMYNADVANANIECVTFNGVCLSNTNIDKTKIDTDTLNEIIPMRCPETGSFIGWKKACDNYIVKLEITDDAERVSTLSGKCRCSKAKCIAIENMDGADSGLTEVTSIYDSLFIYKVGETAEVSDFDKNRLRECSRGIHFFLTRQEAVEY